MTGYPEVRCLSALFAHLTEASMCSQTLVRAMPNAGERLTPNFSPSYPMTYLTRVGSNWRRFGLQAFS